MDASEVNLAAVATAYAAGAEAYANDFGDDLLDNAFDRHVLTSVLRGVPAHGHVLDVGCGPAQVSALANSLGHSAIGVDLTPAMLAVARTRVGIPLVAGNVLCLPFGDATFDAALCWFSLHNLPRAFLPRALDEVARVVRPAGLVAMATHCGRGQAWHGEVVVTYYETSEVGQLLRSAGFADVVVRTRPPLPNEHQVTKLIASGRR